MTGASERIECSCADLIAERLAGPLGQPVVVENRGGAGGAIGVDAVAKAAPAGTRPGLIARLNAEINAVLSTREMQERMARIDTIVGTGTPEQFSAQIASEHAANARIIREAGLRLDEAWDEGLAPPARIERATFPLGGGRSIH